MDGHKCFVCGAEVNEVFMDSEHRPVNRIVDDKNETYYWCALCLRKVELGHMIGLVTGTRPQREAIREGLRRIKYDDEILKRYDRYFK